MHARAPRRPPAVFGVELDPPVARIRAVGHLDPRSTAALRAILFEFRTAHLARVELDLEAATLTDAAVLTIIAWRRLLARTGARLVLVSSPASVDRLVLATVGGTADRSRPSY